jgi:hypothetical protein
MGRPPSAAEGEGMTLETYITGELIPFVKAVASGKAKKNFYKGWAQAILEHRPADIVHDVKVTPQAGGEG